MRKSLRKHHQPCGSLIMSRTATVSTKNAQAVAEWLKVFPQVTGTYTSSVTFMKQLTTVALSTITFLKDMFLEENYTVEQFSGINLKILNKKCKDENAQFVSTALSHAFEAFDKKYLRRLALCFYDGSHEAENLIESHIFEYSYTPAGVTMDMTSKVHDQSHNAKYSFDNIHASTVRMIRTCVVMMQTCNQLPPSYDISLRLYYNDDAPDGYQAPGFLSAAEVEDHLECIAGSLIQIGAVGTPHHWLRLSSYLREVPFSSHEAQPSQSVPVMTQNEGNDFGNADVSFSEESKELRVVCACGKTDTDDELMLTCHYCNTQQHGACFGRMTRVAYAAVQHCCTRCSDQDACRVPTDARLAQKTHKREDLCILRRVLAWCANLRAVGPPGLIDKFALTRTNALKLIQILQKHGVIDDNDTDIMARRRIDPDKLNILIHKFFTSEDNLVGRLLVETLSQGSHSDPVGDVLGTMEKVSLRNASTIGKIIEVPKQESAMEDATLKQYREVTLSHQQTEELPLSGDHNPVKDMDTIGKRIGKRKAGKKNVPGVQTKRARTRMQ